MTTFVLLRGLGREARHWGDAGLRLQRELGPGDTVIALDLPGNGTRHLETSPICVSGLLAACRADVRLRDVAPPLVLVSMSLGALVALQWCQAAPQDLAGCVLVNTSVRGISPFWQRLRPRHWLSLLCAIAPGVSLLARERRVLAMTSSDPSQHAPILQRWTWIAASNPVRRGNVLRQLLAAGRYAAPAQLRVAALVLASARDALVDPRCSRDLARQWGLPIREHPTAGHDLPLDDPQWFVTQVVSWSRCPGQASSK